MKHYMLPRTPFLRDANPSMAELPSPSPNPTPQKQQKSNRKQRSFSKENSDPNTLPDTGNNCAITGKQSPAQGGKTKSPLPPRPPNPLKRKLSVDEILADAAGPCSVTDSGVKVVVRMRPLRKDEVDTEMIVQKLSDDSLTINGQTFTFDSVADTASSQLDIFQLVGAPLVENCLAGFNSSVFAYGQTGSGKTYTMWGPPNALLEQNLLNDQLGLTPRVFERLLARIDEEQIKHADKQLKYQCRCSFLEIYNEQITDLLEPSQKNLQIREDVKSGVYVENLTEEYVSSMKDVVQLLLKGLANRRIGSTSINAESSRSHSVFTCVVESRSKSEADGLSSFKTSRINLVDLAGSERQKLTGAAGERLKEAGNINRSLSQLGNLINILAEVSQNGKQRHIPYRDSRLTFLLQESLGGNAKMAMICAVSPAQRCKSETFSTLRFAQRAKAIKNKAVVNEVMQDDVNSLREMIRQLKDELFRMKAHGGQSDPNGAYSNGWSARRSLNLLKFSLSRPTRLHRLDDDGDEMMDIDEEVVEQLCVEAGLQLASEANRSELVEPESLGVESPGEKTCELLKRSTSVKGSDASDTIMAEGTSEIDDKEDDTILVKMEGASDCSGTGSPAHFGCAKDGDCSEKDECPTNGPLKDLTGSDNKVMADFDRDEESPQTTLRNSVVVDCVAPNLLSIVPCDASPALQSPAPSVSPRVHSSGRKSLRASLTLTASHKDLKGVALGQQLDAHTSMAKSKKQSNSKSPKVGASKSNLSGIENLAASIHHGLEIIDTHMQTSPLRRSPYRFSLKPTDMKPIIPVERADVGVQTAPEEAEFPVENRVLYICSNCRSTTPPDDSERAEENQNLQLVPLGDSPPSAEKAMMMLPKAVEKVLAGAIRREMALEEFGAHQTSEIVQLKRLVQQYKHERECNAIIAQIRDEKISRLEHFMDGVLPSAEFIDEELLFLKREHELLKEKFDHHPEVLDTKLQLRSVQDELEKYKNFFDMGERDVLLEEIQDLRSQLQLYTDHSHKVHGQSSPLHLTYPSEPISSPPLNSISKSMEENSAEEKLEQERNHWTKLESKWISLTEELRADLDACHSTAKKLTQKLDSEKKCSEELKEALQLAMEGHARMLEQYADLEERHMEMLARHRQMQEGIADVKKAAARAGVSRAESKFINSLATEISALRVEREKERRYLRDENKMLQSQLRDTAEAVQAAGELLVRLKEAEEAVSAAEKRATSAEEETYKVQKQIEKLKKKHEKEVSALNQIIAQSTSCCVPKEGHFDSNASSTITPKYDEPDSQNIDGDDDSWKEAFAGFYNNDGRDTEDVTKFDEPSSWFAGYDRCNI